MFTLKTHNQSLLDGDYHQLKTSRLRKIIFGLIISGTAVLALTFCTFSLSASGGNQIYSGVPENTLSLSSYDTRGERDDSLGDNFVHLYYDKNFAGGVQAYTVRSGEDNVRITFPKDTFSSASVGHNIKVKFCEHANCGGDLATNTFSAIGPIKWHDLGHFHDELNEMIISHYDEASSPLVMGGKDEFFSLGTTMLFEPGKYNKNQMQAKGLNSNQLDSIYVPYKLGVNLYKEDNFGGESLNIFGEKEINSLHDEPGNYYDTVESLIVRDLVIDLFVGYWVLIDYSQMSNDISGEYESGPLFSQDDTFTHFEQLIYDDANGRVKSLVGQQYDPSINHNYFEYFKWYFKNAMDHYGTNSNSGTYYRCTSDTMKPMGVWVWIMEGYRGSELANTAQTIYFKCRYDDRAFVSPPCIIYNCMGEECEKCFDR